MVGLDRGVPEPLSRNFTFLSSFIESEAEGHPPIPRLKSPVRYPKNEVERFDADSISVLLKQREGLFTVNRWDLLVHLVYLV